MTDRTNKPDRPDELDEPLDAVSSADAPPAPDGSLPAWHPIAKASALAVAAAADRPVPSRTYSGGCHCGAVRFDVTLAPPLEDGHAVVRCSCSVCRRLGYLLVYPTRDRVVFRNGGGGQARCAVYRFNLRVQDHLFCHCCGTSVMIDFRERFAPVFHGYGINVRALDGVNLDKLTYVEVDGAKDLAPVGDTSGQWYADSDSDSDSDDVR